MAVPLYMDVHVPRAITEQLRSRGVDVLTAIEDGQSTTEDDSLLEHASNLGRLIFTQDIRLKALAETWQADGRQFAGLVFGHQMHGSIGQYVKDLELIADASDPGEWRNVIDHLPY